MIAFLSNALVFIYLTKTFSITYNLCVEFYLSKTVLNDYSISKQF